jgi:hypothetical protein
MCAFYSALRVRPFDPDPERTEEEVAAVRLGCTLDELKPGASRVSYVGEELTEQGKQSAMVNTVWFSGRHWEKFPKVVRDDGEWIEAQPVAEQSDCFDWAVARGALRVLLGEHRGDGTTFGAEDAAWGEAKDVVLLAHTVQNAGAEFTVFGNAPWTDASMGIFPRLVKALLSEAGATHSLKLKVFQQVEGMIWDLLCETDGDGDGADDEARPGGGSGGVDGLDNPRRVAESLDTVPGTLKTKEICWLDSVPLESWDDFVEAFAVVEANARSSSTTYNAAALHGHIFYEVEVVSNETGDSHSLFAVRLVADPLQRDVELVRSDATLRGYGVTRESASATYEAEHPGELMALRRRALACIRSVNDLGDLCESFVAATHKKGALAGGREWAGKAFRQRYECFPAKFLKERIYHALTLLVGAIRPEAESSREMVNTLKFFKRVFARPREQFIGAYPAEGAGQGEEE